MHKSKLAGFIIDCHNTDTDTSSRFWGPALGMEIETPSQPGEQQYIRLLDRNSDLNIEVQQVNHPSRVHLDIETDNIELEVKRLERLGAKVVEYVKTWCVMEAPTGHRFCVVKNYSPNFESEATAWN